MSSNPYPQGTPCWVDLATPDLPGALAFYASLFGWTAEMGPAEMGHYSTAMLDDAAVAGLSDQHAPGPVAWLTHLAVDDVDDVTARVPAHGGTVLAEPMDVGPFGRMAVVADCGGAVVSFWQAREMRGADVMDRHGSLCWNELTTRAVQESLDFYRGVVGMEAEHTPAGGMDYYEFRVGGRGVAGLMPMVGDMWPEDLPNHWMVYFAVDDADLVAARCIELGGQAPVPPQDIPPGRFAVLNDPQGAHFSILRMNEQLRGESGLD